MRPSLQILRFHPIDQGSSLGELGTLRNTSDVAARGLFRSRGRRQAGADQIACPSRSERRIAVAKRPSMSRMGPGSGPALPARQRPIFSLLRCGSVAPEFEARSFQYPFS